MYPFSTKLKHKALTAASDDMHNYTNLGGYSPQLHLNSSHPTLVPGSGVEAVLALLDNCGGKRLFWPAEKLVISQFREWSPLEDLEAVHSAMVMQKELLLQRIRCQNPLFTEPLSAVRQPRTVVINESNNIPYVDSSTINAAEVPPIVPLVTTHGNFNLSIATNFPDLVQESSLSRKHTDLDPSASSGGLVPPEDVEVDLRDGETMYVVFNDDLLDGDDSGGRGEVLQEVNTQDCQGDGNGQDNESK